MKQRMEYVGHIDLSVEEATFWERYVFSLKHHHVRLKVYEDELIWSNNVVEGYYTPKLGYMLCEAILGQHA